MRISELHLIMRYSNHHLHVLLVYPLSIALSTRNHTNDTVVSCTSRGLPPLKDFTVEKLLLLNPKLKIMSVSGKFAGRPDDLAVIFAEKHPLKESDLNELFSDGTKLTPNIENDIYGQYQAVCPGGVGTLKLLTVYPATDSHVANYSDQAVRIVHETPEDYQTVTKPFIESQAFGLQVRYMYLQTSLFPGSFSQKGEESLVTLGGETFDFRHIVIHVIDEGHSHFCGKSRVSYKYFQGIPGFIKI